MKRFVGKVVLITGSSAGIGEASAKKFASCGASLALTGRDQKNLEKVAQDCKELGAKDVLTILAEFSKLDDVKKSLDATIEKFSRLDVLVNNAGTIKDGNLSSITMEDFDMLFNINVKSMLYLTQLAMPHLVKAKGNVVNVSSLSSVRQFPGGLIYSMTKAAVDQFTKTVALEYAPKGVRVNAVNPAHVKTTINRARGYSEEQTNKFYESARSVYPLGRVGAAEEIASAIFFLASDASAWTTGQCMIIDGGRSLTVQQS